MRGEPPERFFDDLRALCAEIRAGLGAEGFKINRWESLPDCDWPDGWWNFRGVVAFARDAYGNSTRVERELDVRKYRRRLRKVKR